MGLNRVWPYYKIFDIELKHERLWVEFDQIKAKGLGKESNQAEGIFGV